jgi:hypothetical protein
LAPTFGWYNPGGVNTIDAFEGGLAEDHVRGSDLGPLFQAIIANQFTRLRDGDRFFYLNERFTPEEAAIMRQGNTLTRVIEANTNITNLQPDAFYFRASIGGAVALGTPNRIVPAGRRVLPPPNRPLGGYEVELEDASGDVLATTYTDARGHYAFTQLSGPAANPDLASGLSGTGTYQAVVVPSGGYAQISPAPNPITISAGDANVQGVNFTMALSSPTALGQAIRN